MVVPSEPLETRSAHPRTARFVRPLGSDVGLWEAVGRGDLGASAEMFDRHGADAYAVAHTVTGDSGQAEQAVIAAFVELRTEAAERHTSRPLRVEILDPTRRCAGRVGSAGAGASRPRRPRPPDVYRSMPPDVRDALALATAGWCGCVEIAAIIGVDRATVRLDLRAGLRHAASVLERWGGAATRGASTGDRR